MWLFELDVGYFVSFRQSIGRYTLPTQLNSCQWWVLNSQLVGDLRPVGKFVQTRPRLSPTSCKFNTHCRRDSTRQLSRVSNGGVYWANTYHSSSPRQSWSTSSPWTLSDCKDPETRDTARWTAGPTWANVRETTDGVCRRTAAVDLGRTTGVWCDSRLDSLETRSAPSTDRTPCSESLYLNTV